MKLFAKSKEEKTDASVIAEMREMLSLADKARRVWEVDAYVNMAFLDNRQRVFYNTTAGRVENTLVSEGSADEKMVNLSRAKLRSLKNIVTKNMPAWSVKNTEGMKASEDEKDAACQLLMQTFRRQRMKEKMKDAIDHGMKKTWCLFVSSWDKKSQAARVDIWDPLDCFPDPGSPEPEDWEFLITCRPRSKKWLKKTYPEKETEIERLSLDHKRSAATLKEQFEQGKGGISTDTVLTYQVMVKEYEGEKTFIRRYVIAGDTILKSEVMPNYEHFGQFCAIYFPERFAGQLYFTPWMSDVISLNKILNRNFTNIDEYDDMMTKGRFLAHSSTKMSRISTRRHGQIVKYTGQRPEYLSVPPLPSTTFEYQDRVIRYMEDVAGVHGESMGRQSGSAESGVALSILVGKDADNAAEPVTNMEDTMRRVGEQILLLNSWHLTETSLFIDDDDEETTRELKIIGEAVQNAADIDSGTVTIKHFRDIVVEIVPGSTLSDIYNLEMLINMRQNAQVRLPDAMLIEAARLGSARKALRKYEKEQEEKKKKNADILLAEGRLRKMIEEGIPQEPQEGDNLEVHLALGGQVLASLGEDHPAAPLIQNYMFLCEQFLQGGDQPTAEQGAEMPEQGQPPMMTAMPQ